jgi:hypothetical protein
MPKNGVPGALWFIVLERVNIALRSLLNEFIVKVLKPL